MTMPDGATGVSDPRLTQQPPARPVPAEVLARVQALYDSGQCLKALQAAEAFAPLAQWTDTPGRVLAARLGGNLGAYRLAHVHYWKAWRAEKTNPDLAGYYGNSILSRRGPLAALEFVERYGEPAQTAAPEGQMHVFTLRASLAAYLRDFSAGERWLERAAEASPENPWVATTRAQLLELQDRYAEALEAARQALVWRPWYRPGLQAVAHALQLLDRDEEALEFLREANRQVENMHLARQLCALEEELNLYDQAVATLDRFVQLAPLMEKAERQWLQRHRLKLDCLRNDWPTVLAAAKQIDEPDYRELAERIESGGPRRRVRLDVPFVRQHHLTCSPATLSAISRFWRQPVEHLEVAEAICYDGTPAHSERNWAETHGWAVREFKVTWASALALLERGIPFTLTTSGPTSGHLQAVVGFDEARQTLLIRDPFIYSLLEISIKLLLESQCSTGPRGMALVPAAQAHLLDGLELPESALYDGLNQIETALAQHRRADALTLCQEMQTAAPNHRLALAARHSIAAYDGNTPALLDCFEQLLKQFPEDARLNLGKLGCLRELAHREERLRLLESLASKRNADPIFWLQYAQELRSDARQQAAAASWVRWALRYRPTDPTLLSAWADSLWDRLEFDQATRYYRLAACLGDKNEAFARSFFIASRHLNRPDQALDFLNARHERLGRRSAEPTITLVESFQQLRRTGDALAVLEAALASRPEDGTLHLFASDLNGRLARFDTAEKLLSRAREHCPPVKWYRAAASLAGYQNQKSIALQHWREVLKLEPLSHEAIRAAALLLAETEGREKALEFLNALCEEFPYSCPLLALRIQWLGEDGAGQVVPFLRRLLEVNPADAWAWRELALKLEADGRGLQLKSAPAAEEGPSGSRLPTKTNDPLEAVQEAIRLEPHHSSGYSVRASILWEQGKILDAHVDFGKALRLEVDNDYALTRFVDTAPNLAERKQALAEVAAELRRQVIFRDALLAYQTAARGLLPAQEVLSLLREAHAARPDLWQSWSVLTQQLVDMGQHDEALQLAHEATSRFPLLPQLWVDLARVEHARLNAPAEIAALEKALAMSPGYTHASRLLAGVYERQHELAKAREVLEQAVADSPLEAMNHGCLARVLWEMGERDRAIDRIQHALRLQPGYQWGWTALRNWGGEAGRPNLALDMARDLTRCRAGEPRSWLILARCLEPDKNADELFAALDKAIALNPRADDAYDQRARALASLDRFDEALAQCSPPGIQPLPVTLLLRGAWVEAQRGNLPQAIARAKNALAEHPDYYAGWQVLSDWYVEAGQLDKAVEAAEKMAALAPLEAIPLGYLGDLKLRLNDRTGAKAAFERAFTLDPDYKYAGFQLFHQQLSEQKLEGAKGTLKVLQRHGEDAATVSCAVELATASQEWDRALEQFTKLAGLKEAESWAIARAAGALDERGRRRTADDVLDQRISTAQCGTGLAEFWVERQVRRGRWRLHKQLKALQASGEPGRRAVVRYLDLMGEAFQAARDNRDVTTPWTLRYHFHRLFRNHRDWLKSDVQGWGKVGYLLTCIGRPQPVIDWLSDWRQRPNAESWMLYNLTIMLQRRRRHEEARELIRHAVSLRHTENLYESFRVWAAFEEALQGNAAEAEAHLATLPAGELDKHLHPIRTMTKLLGALERPADGSERPTLRAVRNELRASFGKRRPCQASRNVRDSYWRFLKAAALRLPRLRWWGWWYYRGPAWLVIPVVIALLPAAFFIPPLAIPLAVLLWKTYQRE